MYVITEKAIKELEMYKQKSVAERVGMLPQTLSSIKKGKSISKLTAYCLTKFLDSEAEIEDYFIRKEK